MAEVLDQEKKEEQAAPTASTAPAERKPAFSESAPAPKKRKKNKKKIIRRIVALLIVAALAGGGYFAWKQFGPKKDDGEAQMLTEEVSRGSITSVVEGSGAAVPLNSASVTLLSGGQVIDVYVAEGDYVTKGDPLYTIESTDAQLRVNDALKSIANYEKELSKLYEAANDLNVRAPYRGKLLEVKAVKVGETVAKGQEIATIVDDTQLLLPLYFSYAYEDSFYVGQSATISIPVTMSQLAGTVHEIRKVERISDEGGKLFAVIFALDNPGTLKADMLATATVYSGGETIYPYEPGALEYFRTDKLTAKVGGEVSWVNLYQYQGVDQGESVLSVTADSNDTEIASLENQLRAAKKTLEDAQKNLDSLNAVAPIDGTVLTLGVTPGEEAKTGTVAVSIADMTTMKIEAQIDEMYISYIKTGMPVDLKVGGETEMMGTVDSVSLSAKAENGVARFPITILVDNGEGLLRSGAYVEYTFTASQSEDCLLVPIQCVKTAQTTDGKSCKILYVQRDEPVENPVELAQETLSTPDGFRAVYVEVGISDNRNVEILSGVEEFEIVYAGVVENTGGGMGMMF